MKSFFICVVVAIFTGFGAVWPPHLAEATGVAPTPNFQVFQAPPVASDLRIGDLDGGIFNLSDLKGNVVLLNFWRKDCQYCVQEKSYLKKLLKQMNRSDLKVVCVDFWDNPSWVRSYGRDNSEGLVIGANLEGRRSVLENLVKGRLLGYYVLNEANEAVYEIKGFPSTYVIDKQGRVVASHIGMVEWTKAPVQKWLAGLLGSERQGNSTPEGVYQLPGWLDRLLAPPNRARWGALQSDSGYQGEVVVR